MKNNKDSAFLSDEDIIHEFRNEILLEIMQGNFAYSKDVKLVAPHLKESNINIYNGDRDWTGEYYKDTTNFRLFKFDTDILDGNIQIIMSVDLENYLIQIRFYLESYNEYLTYFEVPVKEWNKLIIKNNGHKGLMVNRINSKTFTKIEKIVRTTWTSERGPHFGLYAKVYYKNGSSKNLYIPTTNYNTNLMISSLVEELHKYNAESNKLDSDYFKNIIKDKEHLFYWKNYFKTYQVQVIKSEMLPGPIYSISYEKTMEATFDLQNLFNKFNSKEIYQKMDEYLNHIYPQGFKEYSIKDNILKVIYTTTVTHD